MSGIALTREQELKLLTIAQNSEVSAVAPYTSILALRTGIRMKEIKHLMPFLVAERPRRWSYRWRDARDTGSR